MTNAKKGDHAGQRMDKTTHTQTRMELSYSTNIDRLAIMSDSWSLHIRR